MEDLEFFLKSRPWLVPVVACLKSEELRARDIALELGTSARVVKRALLALARLGLVERIGEGKYRLAEGARERVERALAELNTIRQGRLFVVDLGAEYAVLKPRRRYVRTRRIGKEVVEIVSRAREDLPPCQLAAELGVGAREVALARRVARLLGGRR